MELTTSSDDQPQKCAICLDDLFAEPPSSSSSTVPLAGVGAVVNCGHCFHQECFRRWRSHTKRRAASKGTHCPMCNAPATNFVKLFLGEGNTSSKNASNATAAARRKSRTKTPPPPSSDTSGEDDNLLVLTLSCHDSAKRLDRVKDKLHRYKRENRSLEQSLEEERQRSVQLRGEKESLSENLRAIQEKQSKERRVWKRQQRRLQEELDTAKEDNRILQASLDRALEQKAEEREILDKQQKRTLQELEEAKKQSSELQKEVQQMKRQHEKDTIYWRRQRGSLQQSLKESSEEINVLRTEIDRTVEFQVEERRNWERKCKQLEEDLIEANGKTSSSNSIVSSEIKGDSHLKRQETVDQVIKERDDLARQLKELKAMVHASMMEQDSVYFEARLSASSVS